MGELFDYFSEKFKKNTSATEEQMMRIRVKNAISDLCDEYLKGVGSIFTFEVLPKDLPYAVMVINEEPLKSKYIINQIGKTLFQAELREVEI